ncbi:MAG TPA: hypothetical protein GX401_03275 [Clostridiales bacterium]|nr:hypothetical protein [Clostridiales bacterium]
MELFKLLGTIAIDNGDANKAIDDTTDKAQDSDSKMSKFFNSVGKGAAVCGKVIAKGIAIGSGAMVGLTTKAMNMTGELEQNLGGSEAVFKDFAGKMQETAKTAFSNMGLSASDFLGTANKMGALFQGAGFSIQESSELSASAMQRAADVASIMGISTQDAMEAVAGAAKGNFTMMDNLGVAMNDTAIQNYALSKGISKTTAEMTQQEKIGLAMEMFMEKTSYAAGNYAKENETLAGSLGTAKSALTNFLDGSGSVEDVVKSFSNAANVIVKNLNELVPKLVSGITELINQVVPMLPPLLQSLLPGVIEGAVQLINGLVAALPMVIDALMTALPGLIEGVVQILLALSAALINSLPMVLPALIDGVIQLVVGLAQGLPQIIQLLVDSLPEIIINVVQALMNNLPTLIQGCVQLVVGIVQAIPQITLSLIDALPTIIKSVVTGLWNALPVLLNGVIEMVGSIGKSVWSLLEGYWSRLGSFFKGIWDGIKNIFSGVGDWFSGIFKSAYNGITGIFSKIGGFFSDVFGKIGNIVKAPLNFVIKGLNSLIGGLNKISFDIPDWIPVIGGKKFGFNIGKIPELAKGGIVEKPTQAVIGEAGDEAVVPLENNTGWIKRIAEQLMLHQSDVLSKAQSLSVDSSKDNRNDKHLETLIRKFDQLLEIIAEYFPGFAENMQHDLVLDTGALVGQMTPAIDRQLGVIYKRNERGG